MKKFNSQNFYQIFFVVIFNKSRWVWSRLVKISEKKFFGKNLVIWIFSLNSKKQGLYYKVQSRWLPHVDKRRHLVNTPPPLPVYVVYVGPLTRILKNSLSRIQIDLWFLIWLCPVPIYCSHLDLCVNCIFPLDSSKIWTKNFFLSTVGSRRIS